MDYSSINGGGSEQREQLQSHQKPVHNSQASQSAPVNIPMSARLFDGVITVSLVALTLGLPIFFTSMTMQGILFDKVMYLYFWTLLALVSWAAKGAVLGKLRITRTQLDMPIMAVLVVAVISTVFSIDWWQSFWGAFGDPSRGVLTLIMMIVLYYIVMDHFTMARFRWMFAGLLVSGSIVSIWTFLGLLGVQFLPQAIIAVSPLSLLGTFGALAVFLAMMVPLIMTGIFTLWQADAGDSVVTKGRIWRTAVSVILGGVLIVTMLNLLSLFVHVTWSAVVVGTFFFLMYILAHVVRPAKALIWIPMLVVVLVAGFLMIGGKGAGNALIKVGQLPNEIMQTQSLSWDVAYSAMKNNVIVGTGPATYEQVYTLNRPENLNQSDYFGMRFGHGTNIVLDTLATMGVLGVIVVIVLLLTYVGIAIYLLSRGKERNKIVSLGWISAMLVVLTAALVGVGGNVLIAGLVAIIALAVLFAQSDIELRRIEMSLTVSPKFALTMAFISIVVITGVGAGFFYVGKVWLADMYAGKAVRAEQVGEDSVANLAKAQALYPRESRYAMRLGQEYAVLANRELLKSAKERNIDNLRAYLQLSERATWAARAQSPHNLTIALAYASVVENQGYYAGLDNPDAVIASVVAVQDAYAYVQNLDPFNPTYFVKQGEWELRRAGALTTQEKKDDANESLEEAEEWFTQAIAKKELYPAAYYQRAQSREALANLDGAIEDAQVAVRQTNQMDINAVFKLGQLYQARGTKDDQARAEIAFRSILGVNDKEINALFSLATLYEQAQYYSEAITQYRAVLELLPEEDTVNRERIEKLINKLRGMGSSVIAPTVEVSTATESADSELPTSTGDENVDTVVPTPTDTTTEVNPVPDTVPAEATPSAN